MSDSEHQTPGMPVEPGTAPKKSNGAAVICVKDPLGCVITMDVHTWEHHITPRHPEMREYLEAVRETLEHPELIQRSTDEPTTAYYYRLQGNTSQKLYVSVVVARNAQGNTGTVKTAHLLRKLRNEESGILWLKRQ